MMSDDEPTRLKDSRETAPELQRALRALKQHSGDAARLDRVAEALGAALAKTPEAAGAGFRATATKILLGLIVVGAATYAWFSFGTASAPLPRHTNQAANVDLAPAAPLPPAAPQPAPAESPAPLTPVSADSVTVPSKLGVRRHAPRPTPPARANTRSTPSALAPSASDSTPEVSSSAAAPEPARALSAPARDAPARQETQAVPPSEASLLFKARSLAHVQPEAALHWLDEHAKAFPHGMLAPEREVLRIEVLRALGRDAEADQRMRAFEAQHPSSIHLRRLQKSAR